MAVIHSFHIFFKNNCIYRTLYTDASLRAVRRCGVQNNSKDPPIGIGSTVDADSNKQYEKLLIGFLSGLSSFSKTINMMNDLKVSDGLSIAYFNSCTTYNFKIHYLETITGYKLVCITSPDSVGLDKALKTIYVDLITNIILSNPLYEVGTMIESVEFDELLYKTLTSTMLP